jgi:hypothetical protein
MMMARDSQSSRSFRRQMSNDEQDRSAVAKIRGSQTESAFIESSPESAVESVEMV